MFLKPDEPSSWVCNIHRKLEFSKQKMNSVASDSKAHPSTWQDGANCSDGHLRRAIEILRGAAKSGKFPLVMSMSEWTARTPAVDTGSNWQPRGPVAHEETI